jgi:hypothetical protein
MRLGSVLPVPLADAREMADGTRLLGYLLLREEDRIKARGKARELIIILIVSLTAWLH